MKDCSLNYYAFVDSAKSPGVAKKVENTVLAARQMGLQANCYCFPRDIGGVFGFLNGLINNKSEFVIIRFSDLISPLFFFLTIYLRLRGSKVIVDVPTPRITALKEINSAVRNRFFRGLRKCLLLLCGSWILYPANRVVQYASESFWFEFGVKQKTLKIGNGILIDNVPLVDSIWPANELKLIGVAQLASWHGYDRIINALAIFNKNESSYNVSFTVVGEGSERGVLEALVEKLGLHEQVNFTGMLSGKELDMVFSDKHIGVASLGLYRKGLSEASDLKTREYISRGLHVIGAGLDPDFEHDSPYRFLVSNEGTIDDIVDLLLGFAKADLASPVVLQAFAESNLSLKSKLKMILDDL